MSSRTDALEFARVYATNATDATFPSRVATTTQPADAGVVDLRRVGGSVYDNVALVFYGTGNDNDTFDARVIGWRKVSTLWVPVPLCQLTATLSAAVGVASAAVLDTERFADTVALAAGYNANVSAEVVTPTGDVVAHVCLDTKGFTLLEVTFDLTGATDANALWAGY